MEYLDVVRKDTNSAGSLYTDVPNSMLVQRLTQNPANFVATKMFPVIPTDHRTGDYYKWESNSFNAGQAFKLAEGTAIPQIRTQASLDHYACDVWGVGTNIPFQTAANAFTFMNTEEAAVSLIANNMLIKQESNFADTAFKNGVWSQDLQGAASASSGKLQYWSDDSTDPIKDIKNIVKEMALNAFHSPSDVLFSYDVFQRLSVHPAIIDRLKYAGIALCTAASLAYLISDDNFDGSKPNGPKIHIGKAVKKVFAEGDEAHATSQFVFNNGVLFTYNDPIVAVNSASAGYTFNWTAYAGGMNTAIISYPDIPHRRTVYEGEMAYTQHVACPDMGAFIGGILKTT